MARSSNDIDSPVKGSLGQTINDEGHASPSRSPSPSPKHGKLESRKHHPHSTDDESDGDMKKPRPSSKSNLIIDVLLEVTLFKEGMEFNRSVYQRRT